MEKKKHIRILSIDGGGIRGIIPAMVLAHIEERVGKPICDLFDLFAGTSTGGIIALALVKPDEDGDEMGAPAEAASLYRDDGQKIFHGTFSNIFRTIRALVYNEKYNSGPIERSLKDYFGDVRLGQALKPVIIPTYDIENRVPRFFKSRRNGQDGEIEMWKIARATSAAPTFFECYDFTPPDTLQEQLRRGTLVDGGVIANNPAMCAYAEMMKHGESYVEGFSHHDPVLLVSLGTGNVGKSYGYHVVKNWGQAMWAKNLIADMFTNGSVSTIEYQLEWMFKARENSGSTYFRFQPAISDMESGMDDASDKNLNALRQAAEELIERKSKELDDLVTILRGEEPLSPPPPESSQDYVISE